MTARIKAVPNGERVFSGRQSLMLPRHSHLLRHGLAAFCLLACAIFLHSQQLPNAASLSGTVRDSQGKTVAGALIQLQSKESAQTQTATSDPQGKYAFTALHEGVYNVRVKMSQYAEAEVPSLFLAAREAKTLDLSLGPTKATTAAGSPQFFDQPQFTVAGVTDTTSLGGHGSDNIVRARESLAKDTVSLGKSPESKPSDVPKENGLAEILKRQPNDFGANFRLGVLLVDKGNATDAIPYLERAAAAKPDDYQTAYELALANSEAGNYDRARAQVRTLFQHHDTAELHHLSGHIAEKLGDPLEAVRQYQRAAEMDARESYLFDWGSELLLHHAPEPALDVFTKGNHLYPKSSRMLIGLGAAWFTRGSYDQAVQQLCAASDLNPSDPAPYLFLGKLLQVQSSASSEAVERLHRFVVLQPQNAEANYFYAVALMNLSKGTQEKERESQIERLLKDSIHLDPNFAPADLQLGIIHSDMGDFSAAVSDYQRAIKIAPQMEEAHYRLAQAYRGLGEADKAREELGLYAQLAKESAQQEQRERHEIRQFVYTLRDQPSTQAP